MRSDYSNGLYKMYEEVVSELDKSKKEIHDLKLLAHAQKTELASANNKLNVMKNKLNVEINKATKTYIEEITKLKDELNNALNEIERLKTELASSNENVDKNYIIDKLNNSINKNSTNSSIPTSKQLKKEKTGANIYNHRNKTNRKTGGQLNHIGKTLTKEQLEQKIETNNLEIEEIKHYIKSDIKKENKVKYTIGISVKSVIKKHIFIYGKNYKEKMSTDYYSDVTYNDSVKALVVMLGNYYSLSYNKIQELLNDLTNGIINLSQGTIDNIYQNFSYKTTETLNNITKNIINAKYTHTDETVTSENGKETYYRGYGNKNNVLYKYHHRKGDNPIKEDNILNNFYGTVISDHEVGLFKYGTNNQDCVVHIGRYCNEQMQNIYEIVWPEKLYKLLLRTESNRKILSKYGRNKFTKEEIKSIENEYDNILEQATKENEEISSTYWKEKSNTLLNRLKKYKNCVLFYIHDFSIDYDNNFMERALRMIKGKTKISGGFRSDDGAIRFGNTMSIIKTARLRKLNVFNCIKAILKGEALFA